MAKKTFKGGLDSLLGEAVQPTQEKPAEAQTSRNKAGRKRTRPDIDLSQKSSLEGLKEGYSRVTYIVEEKLIEDIKQIAYWERCQIKQVVAEALGSYVDKWEKKNGKLEEKRK